MGLEQDSLRIGRDKIARVFRYLEALNQHRNPAKRQIREQIWHLWFHDLPDHHSIRKGIVKQPLKDSTSEKAEHSPDAKSVEDDFVLKVRRPALTQAPPPPEVIASWLEHGWNDPHGAVRVRTSQNEVDERGETRIVHFSDDPRRPRELATWKARREEWAQNEVPARRAMKIFEQLYELYGRIDREVERVELVVGDGILGWRRADGGVYHPVLLQRLQLEFNPMVPEFTLVESEHEVELYSALFRSMTDVDGKPIARCREELADGGYHPLGDESTSGFLRRLVVQLSSRGEFNDDGAPQGETENPQIGRDPVLFLRARILGFATAIEAVLENIQNRDDLPSSLLNIVGIDPYDTGIDEILPPADHRHDNREILFSKPANPEQILIAQQLERHGNVLVQGPPGTGKSHTIANLVGHLLAQGKSVLVTSHTTKALRVLRGHVVEELRPLCVSVLESDIESRTQLEGSVESIVRRLSTSNEQNLDAEAKDLKIKHGRLYSKLEKVDQELLDAREGEYRDIVIAGQSYMPSEAARKIAQETGKNDWIPQPVVSAATLPLSEGEFIDLYASNSVLSPTEEVELSQKLPNPNEVPTPEDFARMVNEKHVLSKLNLGLRSDLWDFSPTKDSLEELELFAERFSRAMGQLASNCDSDWKLAAVSGGRIGGQGRNPWDNLISLINKVCLEATAAQENLVRYGPTQAEKIPLEEQKQIIEEILGHFQDGGKLNRLVLLMNRSWNKFIQESKAGGGPPCHYEHFRALRDAIRLKIARRDLSARWDRQVGSLGAPSSAELGTEPENACAQYIQSIRECLEWYKDFWRPLEKDVKNLGFRWEKFLGEQPPNPASYGDLFRLRDAATALTPIISSRMNAVRMLRVEAEINAIEQKLLLYIGEKTSSLTVKRLREAIGNLDSKSYRQAFQQLVDMYNLREKFELRHDLLNRLEKVAPAWADAIRNRRGHHGDRDLPGDPVAGWLWRQLHDELERRGQQSLELLQQTICSIHDELQQVTAYLIDRKAWAAQVRRTSLSQRQALIGWLDTERRIKKGFGKRVPRLRAEARRKMSECRTAVPVWIMPLARVVETFDPRTTRFDVVIIDEASQSDVMALLALYLARKVVIVGDHEQVSPLAVGQDLAIVQHLIDEYLQGIPNADLYDGQMSIYDLARQSFGGAICLVEHFRCVPEIIQFSNQLSYKGEIRPLRDSSLVQLKPHVISYRVIAARSGKKVNSEEAWAVASLLAAAIEQPEFKDKTFGVISLVGEEQAREIERLLLRYVTPEEYHRRRILCGNSAHFQGDERDVMFLSMVDTNSSNGPLPLREQQMFKQRFNVAASRPRDQMWLIHSLDPKTDLKPGDLRRRLIEHADDPYILLRAMEKGERRVESELEKAVLRRLTQHGYRVIPQWKVGYYRIDLVVEGDGKRLAIECDGDRFHPIEKLPEDMARQAILERLGWTFSRIRGSQFYRDPDSAMEPILSRLKAMEIPAEGADCDPEVKEPADNELKERVIRRAQELRIVWQAAEFANGESSSTDNENGEDFRGGLGTSEDTGKNEHSEDKQDNSDPGGAQSPPGGDSDDSTPRRQYQEQEDIDWVLSKGVSELRRLHRWAKEFGNFADLEVKTAYWVAYYISSKKTEKIKPSDARKVKRLWEKALRKGFIEV